MAQEVAVGADVEGEARGGGGLEELLADAVVAGFDHDEAGGLVLRDGAGEFAGEGLGVGAVVEAAVGDAVAVLGETLFEVAHGAQEERDAGFV